MLPGAPNLAQMVSREAYPVMMKQDGKIEVRLGTGASLQASGKWFKERQKRTLTTETGL